MALSGYNGSACPYVAIPSPATGTGSLPCAVPGTGPNRRKLRGNGIKNTEEEVVGLRERTYAKPVAGVAN